MLDESIPLGTAKSDENFEIVASHMSEKPAMVRAVN